ncbi:MAG: ParA family protein, partial [Pseudomonadota bacterium]
AEAAAAAFGWKVLLVDLDAQASASYALCGDANYREAVADERTLATFFDRIAAGARPEPLGPYVTPALVHDSSERIDVICSEPALRYAERALIERYYQLRMKRVVTASAPEGQTRRIMRNGLAAFDEHYDLIVLDCPPGISIFAEAGVACSDLVVMPSIPDYLSTLGLRELNEKFLRQLSRDGNLHGRTAILRTKVQGANAIHKKYLRELEAMAGSTDFDTLLIGTTISQSADIARAIDSDRQGDAFNDKYKGMRDDLIAYAEEIKGLLEDVVADRERAAEERATQERARQDRGSQDRGNQERGNQDGDARSSAA